MGSSQTEGEKYRLIQTIPIIGSYFYLSKKSKFSILINIGNISSVLIIHKTNRPQQFIFSINSWLLEINSIELKDNLKNKNSTHIEWTVYTKRHSFLFQVKNDCIYLN